METKRKERESSESLIEAYLLGKVSRETVLKEIGIERLEEVEFQRDAIRRDIEWGLRVPE